MLVIALIFQGCASKKIDKTVPRNLCFENQFSERCDVSPPKCTNNKLRKNIGRTVEGVGVFIGAIGFLAISSYFETAAETGNPESASIKFGAAALVVSLPIFFVGTTIEGNQCND